LNITCGALGYTIASIVAFGAIVFRHAIWLQRPATRVYWRRGWKLYLQREKLYRIRPTPRRQSPRIWLTALHLQADHPVGDALNHVGCVVSALTRSRSSVNHFKLEGDLGYRAYVSVSTERHARPQRYRLITFHALDFTAIMVIAGCAIAPRRLRDRGATALQQSRLTLCRTCC
jgi:hypothetical protein